MIPRCLLGGEGDALTRNMFVQRKLFVCAERETSRVCRTGFFSEKVTGHDELTKSSSVPPFVSAAEEVRSHMLRTFWNKLYLNLTC